MVELRDYLAGTIAVQARFMADRMEGSLAKIQAALPAEQFAPAHESLTERLLGGGRE